MNDPKKDLFKNTIMIGIGTFCTKIISFLLVPFYTRWLSPEDYGNYDLIVSYLTLLIPFITLQLEHAVFRFSLTNNKDSKRYLTNALFITLINIVIIDIFSIIILKESTFKYGFPFYFDTYAIYLVLLEYYRGNNNLKEYSFFNIISSILILIFSFIFVPILELGSNGLLCAYGVAFLLVDFVIICRINLLKDLKKRKPGKKEIKEMLKYSLPMIPNGISWWITNVSDRTIIKLIIGSYFNGLYAVACKIPTILTLIYGIFNTSWQQTAILSYNSEDRNVYYKKILKELTKFLFSASFIILTILPFLFKYILSNEYYKAFIYVPILLLGSIFMCLGQFLGGILLASNSTKQIGYTTTISAIINILVNLILMKKFGLIIACISTLISYIYFYLKRMLLLKDIFKGSNNIILLSVLSFIFIFISCLFIKFKNIIYIIILSVFIYIISIFYNKDLIYNFIEKLKFKLNKQKKSDDFAKLNEI